jgi:hypothetical protein
MSRKNTTVKRNFLAFLLYYFDIISPFYLFFRHVLQAHIPLQLVDALYNNITPAFCLLALIIAMSINKSFVI